MGAVRRRPGRLVGVAAVAGYRRSSRTRPAEEVVPPLVESGRAYCLVLRAFGEDGCTIVPRPVVRGRGGLHGAAPNATIEETVGLASRTSSMETYGIVDQTVRLAPPGPTFLRTSDADRHTVASRLIRHARVIVLLLGPDQDLTDGFRWEIEKIVAYGRAARVVIGLPPPDQDEAAHRAALTRAYALLVALGTTGRVETRAHAFAVREYELMIPDDAAVIAHTPRIGIGWWVPVDPPPKPVRSWFLRHTRTPARSLRSSAAYVQAFSEAFRTVERERTGISR